MDSHDEMECKVPEGPILCINNCGFFGSAATMNMCSKCHKEVIMKQEQTKLAASSIKTIKSLVNGSSVLGKGKEPIIADALQPELVETKIISTEGLADPSSDKAAASEEGRPRAGPSRCNACQKRVGLTGFNCKCGNVFCAAHRHSDKHGCLFDYRMAGQDAIAKANPVVKAEKLNEKI